MELWRAFGILAADMKSGWVELMVASNRGEPAARQG